MEKDRVDSEAEKLYGNKNDKLLANNQHKKVYKITG